MKCRQWLLRGRNQILVRLLLTVIGDFVEFLVKLLQLRGLGHVVSEHEMRWLIWLVAPLPQEFQAIVDQGKVEEQPVAGQAIPAMPYDLDASFGIVTVKASQDFVM